MTEAVLPPFTVTRSAIEQIEMLGGAILIDAESGGCCGTTYVFRIVDESEVAAPGVERFGCPGAWLLVGPHVSAALPGATLDYTPRTRPPRFRVIANPNTAYVCPCRRSFGMPWPGSGDARCRSYQPMPWDETFDPPLRWKRQTGYPNHRPTP